MTDAANPTLPGAATDDVVPFRLALRAWFAISLQTFGGPAGQIAVMHRELVDTRRWIGPKRFQHALNYCMLLPGPEAQQLAIYIGWLLNGTRGGLAAGILFVLPGVAAMAGLTAIYVTLGSTDIVTAVLLGLSAAVLAIVAQAVVRVGRRALAHPALVGLAVLAFLALGAFGVPFPFVVLGAGLIGWFLGRWSPEVLAERPGKGGDESHARPLIADELLHTSRPTLARALKITAIGLVLWGIPVAALAAFTGGGSILTTQGLFFSGTAVVTFGGAYAVLAYVAQKAVVGFHWLTATDMIHGLALAETTPGPLIMVVQFVAFVAAYRHPGSLDPWLAGSLGAAITVWVTFVPCFILIFLGAPYVERLRGNRTVAAALGGITAAVVGVIANLALYFAIHTIFDSSRRREWGPVSIDVPYLDSVRPVAVIITLIAALLIFAAKWSVLRTLGICGLLGLGVGLAGIPLTR